MVTGFGKVDVTVDPRPPDATLNRLLGAWFSGARGTWKKAESGQLYFEAPPPRAGS